MRQIFYLDILEKENISVKVGKQVIISENDSDSYSLWSVKNDVENELDM